MDRKYLSLSLTMKCSPVALLNRAEYARRSFNRNLHNSNEQPVYITQGYHGYSFTFLKHQSAASAAQPVLSVKNIQLPEDANTFNTGCSLEKWSKKITRLKSGNKNVTNSNTLDVIDRDFHMTFNVDNLLDSLEENQEDSETPDRDEYEVHSDIEELLRKTNKRKQQNSSEKEKERKKERSSSYRDGNEDKPRKAHRHRHKLKKTLRFSISKPASPKTEQVIRVDVTSNVSMDELRHNMEYNSSNELRPDDYNRGHVKMINGGGPESDGNFNENSVITFDGEDEEFILRCSQLALTQKRR